MTLKETPMRKRRAQAVSFTAVLAVTVLAGTSPVSAQRRGGTVYYQVTHKDGDVTDLAKVPTTDKNIRRVVRITRINEGDRGLRALSTEDTTYVSSGGRTYRDELTWNGKAWVLHEEVRKAQPKVVAPQRDGADANTASKTLEELLAEQRKRTAARVKTYARRLKKQVAKRKAVEKAVEDADDDDAKAAARRRLKTARAVEKQLETLLSLSRQTLKTITGKETRFGDPTGKVTIVEDPPPLKGKTGAGVAKPVSKTHVMPHRVQVWRAPLKRILRKDKEGRRTYRVSMAHPEAGALGEFYYVAYADTDNDGQPDRLIARSPLARATEAGEWTSWSFRTDHERVYVGNALPHARASMYAERIKRKGQWVGLGDRPWVSDTFGAAPAVRGWPFLSNLRIEVQVPWD
jgi:hypothetical protein